MLAVCDHLDVVLLSERIKSGLERVKHLGRLQRVHNFLLDGAHNPAGASVLAAFLRQNHLNNLVLVFGAMKSKNWREILRLILEFCSDVVFPKIDDNFVSLEELSDFVAELNYQQSVYFENDVKSAICLARSLSSNSKLVLVTGSLYLVGRVIQILSSE